MSTGTAKGPQPEKASMTPAAFDALVAAVTLAKSESIDRLPILRRRLASEGYLAEDIDVAIKTWSQYARATT